MTTPNSLSAAAFPQSLAQEAKLVEQFVTVLQQEQTALSEGATERLADYIEQKNQLVTELNFLAEQRNNELLAQNLSADRSGLNAWFKAHPEEQKALQTWTKILALVSEARELNRLNGELVNVRLQHTARNLEALRNSKDPLDLYGPDGKSAFPGQQRIHDIV